MSSSSDAPACVTYARSRSVGDISTQISLGCGQTSGTILALISTTAPGKGSKPTSAAGGNDFSIPTAGVTQSADGSSSSQTPGFSSDSNSNPSNGNTSSSSRSGSKLSAGEIAAIVIPIVAIIVAFLVGWWKRHQVVWCITCGLHGEKHSQRPMRVEGPHPYANPIPLPSYGDSRPLKPRLDLPPTYRSQQSFHPNPSMQQGFETSRPIPSAQQSFQTSHPSLSTRPTFHEAPRPPPQGWVIYDGV